MQSAPLSNKLISPSLHNFLSFLFLFFFLITLAIIFKAIKTWKQDPRKHPLHSLDDLSVLPAFHLRHSGGRQLCANTTTLSSHKGKTMDEVG